MPWRSGASSQSVHLGCQGESVRFCLRLRQCDAVVAIKSFRHNYGRNYDGSKNRDLPSAQATLSLAVGLYLPCFSLYRVQPMNKKLDNNFGFIILLYGVWQVV